MTESEWHHPECPCEPCLRRRDEDLALEQAWDRVVQEYARAAEECA